jgi:hypothetical protein
VLKLETVFDGKTVVTTDTITTTRARREKRGNPQVGHHDGGSSVQSCGEVGLRSADLVDHSDCMTWPMFTTLALVEDTS